MHARKIHSMTPPSNLGGGLFAFWFSFLKMIILLYNYSPISLNYTFKIPYHDRYRYYTIGVPWYGISWHQKKFQKTYRGITIQPQIIFFRHYCEVLCSPKSNQDTLPYFSLLHRTLYIHEFFQCQFPL